MSVELEIEKAAVEYLEEKLTQVNVEALGNTNYDDDEIVNKAQRNTRGYIIIQYMGSQADTPSRDFKQYKIVGKYILYLFTKSRKERDGIYQLLEDVKTNMIQFEYEKQKFQYKGDVMHPFPVSKGLFLCEVEFELVQMRRF